MGTGADAGAAGARLASPFGHHEQEARPCRRSSKDTASETIALDGLDVQLEHLEGGYSVCFESHTADGDLADLFRGLPATAASCRAGAT